MSLERLCQCYRNIWNSLRLSLFVWISVGLLSPSLCQCVCAQRCETKLNNFCMQWALCLFWLLVYFNPIVHIRLPEHLSPKNVRHTHRRGRKNREIKKSSGQNSKCKQSSILYSFRSIKTQPEKRKNKHICTHALAHMDGREELKQQ